MEHYSGRHPSLRQALTDSGIPNDELSDEEIVVIGKETLDYVATLYNIARARVGRGVLLKDPRERDGS
ncbi:MAG: hypothetical protein EXS55_00600 [Candidatus Magasanikbacteria bacterium]|nr:hypothetical protein [Candidatus Magasanikbacteria bacterium]